MFEWLKSLPKTSAIRHYCANVMRATSARLSRRACLRGFERNRA